MMQHGLLLLHESLQIEVQHVHDVGAKRYNQSKSVDVDRLLIKFSCTQIVKSVLLESLELYILRTNAPIRCASAHAGQRI